MLPEKGSSSTVSLDKRKRNSSSVREGFAAVVIFVLASGGRVDEVSIGRPQKGKEGSLVSNGILTTI